MFGVGSTFIFFSSAANSFWRTVCVPSAAWKPWAAKSFFRSLMPLTVSSPARNDSTPGIEMMRVAAEPSSVPMDSTEKGALVVVS